MSAPATLGNAGIVITTEEIIARLNQEGLALERLPSRQTGETAQRYRYLNGGEVGFISRCKSSLFAATAPITAIDTRRAIRPSVPRHKGHDLRSHLRTSDLTDPTQSRCRNCHRDPSDLEARQDRYSELRSENSTQHPRAKLRCPILVVRLIR